MSEHIVPPYHGPFDPVFACRILPTRHCPAILEGECDEDKPCARYETDDPTPWLAEVST